MANMASYTKRFSPDTEKIEPYAGLDEDTISIQQYWNPKVGDKIRYLGEVYKITSIDSKFPDQAIFTNKEGKEEVCYLQDAVWLFTKKDLDDILEQFGLVQTDVGMRIRGVKGFFQKPHRLDQYVKCMTNARFMQKIQGNGDPLEILSKG